MRNNVSEPLDRACAGRVFPERDMRSHLVIVDGIFRKDSATVLRVERETYYFGVTHPSLPNYLSMISGDYFGIQDDNDSCFNPGHGNPCDSVDAPTLIDQLESKHISPHYAAL